MKHGNKYMMPLNGKAIFINVGILLFFLGSAMVISDYFRERNIIMAIIFIAITIAIMFCYVKFMGQAIYFKNDHIKLPQIERGVASLNKTSVRYVNIADVTVCKKGQFGPHVKALGMDGIIPKLVEVDTLVITDKQDNQYLLSLQYYSQKQIKYMVNELLHRASINR